MEGGSKEGLPPPRPTAKMQRQEGKPLGNEQLLSNFWFRQTVNVVFWWFALSTVWSLFAGTAQRGGITVTDVLKVVFFVLLAAGVTWRLPPYVVGLSATWWMRFALSVTLWMFVLDRFWSIIASAWRGGNASFSQVSSAVLFALVVTVVTWYVMPRTTSRG